jgi:HD-like signal output (HDOD) protein
MSSPILNQLFAAMKESKGFPALEQVATNVLSALTDDSKSHRIIANYIAEDVALTQKVLKLANSSMYTPFGQGTSSVLSALQMMGSVALLHVVLSTTLITEAELEDDPNLSRSLLASELARTACTDRAADASIATLMCDLGRLMTTKFLPLEMANIGKRLALGADEDTAAREVLGMTLSEVGVAVAKKWNLPTSILLTIDGTGDPLLVGIARFSNAASHLIQQGKSEEVQALVAALDLPGADTTHLASLVQLKVDQAIAHIAMQPQVPAEHALQDLMKTLSSANLTTVDELAGAMFGAFSELMQTAHCLLFMMTRSGEYKIRYGYGKGIDELKSKLKISADFKPTTFHAVIKNNVDVSIADVSRLKATSLPDGYTQLLPLVNKFVILPIAHERVSGLLYCDWDSDRVFSSAELESVRHLRNLFLPFFPKI